MQNLESKVVDALKRRKKISEVAAEFRNQKRQAAGIDGPSRDLLGSLEFVDDPPSGGCTPANEQTKPPQDPYTCDKNNPQNCTTSVFTCNKFTCKDNFQCNTRNDFMCLDDNTCTAGAFTCSAGHIFYCWDDDVCSGSSFTCSAKNDPACSASTTPAYTGDDSKAGDFLCGSGPGADTFNCSGDKFLCKTADDFKCYPTSTFTCQNSAQCSASGEYACQGTVNCDKSKFSCTSGVSCPQGYCA
jgi:hypothetical protein